MFEAAPRAIHAATRAPADVEAELGIVARMLSGLPTHVHAGEYAAALAAHLASNSDALQQELHRNEHAPASGTTGARPCAWVPTGFAQGTYGVLTSKPTVRRVRPARARALSSPQQDAVAAHCTVRAAMFTHVRTAAAEPVDPDDLAGEAEPGRARAPTVWACILTLPGPLRPLHVPALHAAHACTVLRTRMSRGSATALCDGVARACRSRDGLAAPDGSEPCSISSAAASGRRQRRSWRRSMPRSQLGIARLDALPARCARSARPLLHTRSSRARRCQEGAASARSKRYGQGAR